jgi:hypothetical protein
VAVHPWEEGVRSKEGVSLGREAEADGEFIGNDDILVSVILSIAILLNKGLGVFFPL